jgi:hypothetical protein
MRAKEERVNEAKGEIKNLRKIMYIPIPQG